MAATVARAEDPPPTDVPRPNYWVPALEALAIDGGGWALDRFVFQEEFSRVPLSEAVKGPLRHWEWDDDDFDTNQFLHPWHGALVFTAARSSGVGFWPSLLYPAVSSLLWESFTEVQAPSINDQIVTPLGGAIFGESLHRLAHLVLAGHTGNPPNLGQRIGAALVSPIGWINGLLLGDRSGPNLPGLPLWRAEYSLGLVPAGGRNVGSGLEALKTELFGALEIEQLGVQPLGADPLASGGWHAHQPFDTFDLAFDFAAAPGHSPVPAGPYAQWDLFLRGLLVPAELHSQHDSQPADALWGLYAAYDYSEPLVVRVSTLQLGAGLTGHARLPPGWSIHGTALLSWAVFSNAAAIGAPVSLRDYHLGPSIEALVDVTVELHDRIALRLATRDYLLAGPVSTTGWEDIGRLTTTLRFRIAGPHALSVQVDQVQRDAYDWNQPASVSRGFAVRVFYSFVDDASPGAR